MRGWTFAVVGDLLEQIPPHREVTEERLSGGREPATHNVQTLVSVEQGTLLTQIISYESRQIRDRALSAGIAENMEAGYVRLERDVLGAPTPAQG